jgi:hypothetical protein
MTFWPPVVLPLVKQFVLVRSARCLSSKSLVCFESAHRAGDVSTKVRARKRFHENLFAAGEMKALSRRFSPRVQGEHARLRQDRAAAGAADVAKPAVARGAICARAACEK